MSKKVLYISYDGMTDPLGQSQVIPYLRELTKQGYQFTILSVEKKDRLEQSGNEIRKILSDIQIEWVTLLFTATPPLLSKIYDQHKLNAKAVQLYKDHKFELIHCRSYVAAAAGLLLFKKYRVPFLFDMRGFWVDERVDSGHWNIKKPLYRLLYNRYKKKEKIYFKEAAHIISLTEKGKEELIGCYHIAQQKITVIPCCADLELFDFHKISPSKIEETRNLLGFKEGDKVLTYLGSLGGWYMTDEMLDFFVVMKKEIPAAKFFFITKDNRQAILNKATQKGIDEKDLVISPAGRNEVPIYLSVSEWSIFFIKDVYSKKASSPTKQGEIMGMGIPLICNDIGDTGKIIHATATGIVVKDFSKAAYENVMQMLKNTTSYNKDISRESAFRYYNLENGAASYKEVYQQLIPAHN